MRLVAGLLVLCSSLVAQAGPYRLVIVPVQAEKTDIDKAELDTYTQTIYVAAAAGLGAKNWKIAPEESVNSFFRDLDHRKSNCGFQCVTALGRYFEADVVVQTSVIKSDKGSYTGFMRASVPLKGRELTAFQVEAANDVDMRKALADKAGQIFDQLGDIKGEEPHGPFWWVAVRGNLQSPSGLAGAELDVKVWKLALGLNYGARAGVALSFLPLDQPGGGPYFRLGYSTNALRDVTAEDTVSALGATAGYDFRAMQDRLSLCVGLGSERVWTAHDVEYRPMADVRVGWVFF